MAGKTAERRAGHIQQLGFDLLVEVSEVDGAIPPGKQNGIATGSNGEVYRLAPPRRNRVKKHVALPVGIQQATLDELFAVPYNQEPEVRRERPETPKVKEVDKQNGQIKQLDFNSLEELPPDDAGRVSEGKPAGSGIGSNGAAVCRSSAPISGNREDGVFSSLGDSGRPVSSAGRRVILNEPEPGRQPSRDFRITEAHNVGTGGLHEKAKDNLAAIKLLLTCAQVTKQDSQHERNIA